MSLNNIYSLSDTKWNCKYQIVLIPTYRRKVLYKEKRRYVGKVLRELCERSKNRSNESMPRTCTYAFMDTTQEAI